MGPHKEIIILFTLKPCWIFFTYWSYIKHVIFVWFFQLTFAGSSDMSGIIHPVNKYLLYVHFGSVLQWWINTSLSSRGQGKRNERKLTLVCGDKVDKALAAWRLGFGSPEPTLKSQVDVAAHCNPSAQEVKTGLLWLIRLARSATFGFSQPQIFKVERNQRHWA